MALILDSPMLTSVDEWFDNIEAMGVTTGLSYPGRIEIAQAPDGIAALHSVVLDTDPETATGQRAELRGPAEANAERWYKFDIMISRGWPSGEYLVMQIHDTPDGGESPIKVPNFALLNSEGVGIAYVPVSAPTEAAAVRVFAKFPMALGVWHTVVLHTNSATDTTGFMELIVNGETVGKEWLRACGYADAIGPYFKLGCYDYLHLGGFGMLEAWYRNVKVWSGGESYVSVLGNAPSPQWSAPRPY